MARQHGRHVVCYALALQLARGEVHPHLHRRFAPFVHLRERPTRLVEDPLSDLVDQPAVLGHGDELQGRDRAEGRIDVARQGLEAEEAVGGTRRGGHAHDGLVDDREVSEGHRPRQTLSDVLTSGRHRLQCFVAQLHRIAMPVLRLVHGGIRVAQQGSNRRSRLAHPDADARADRHRGGTEHVLLDECGMQSSGLAQGEVGVGAADDHRELVSAEARDDEGIGQSGAQTVGDLSQQLVPGGMAERVVDGLEAVEVDEQQKRIHPPHRRTMHAVLQHFDERRPVPETGHRIATALLTKLALGPQVLPEQVRDPRRHQAGGAHRQPEQRPASTGRSAHCARRATRGRQRRGEGRGDHGHPDESHPRRVDPGDGALGRRRHIDSTRVGGSGHEHAIGKGVERVGDMGEQRRVRRKHRPQHVGDEHETEERHEELRRSGPQPRREGQPCQQREQHGVAEWIEQLHDARQRRPLGRGVEDEQLPDHDARRGANRGGVEQIVASPPGAAFDHHAANPEHERKDARDVQHVAHEQTPGDGPGSAVDQIGHGPERKGSGDQPPRATAAVGDADGHERDRHRHGREVAHRFVRSGGYQRRERRQPETGDGRSMGRSRRAIVHRRLIGRATRWRE